MDLIMRESVEELVDSAEPIPRVYRDQACPFDVFDDEQFRRRYRFTRAGFFSLVEKKEGSLRRDTQRACPLTTAQQLAITIRVLASRSFQLHAGDSFGASQSTVSRIVARVSDWFYYNSSTFVSWHNTPSRLAIENRVLMETGLPGIVGAIDGTHVGIPKPGTDSYSYVNRKGFASINLAAIVDDRYRFLWFSARWPGRTHDSRVWRESELYQKSQRGEERGRIVGDSAYRAETFLIKMINRRTLSPAQRSYNKAVCRFRAHVEQAFGQLKRQFHALQAGLRYAPQRSSRLIASAICLRNAAIALREPPPYEDEGLELDWEEDMAEGPESDLRTGTDTINTIVENYFLD